MEDERESILGSEKNTCKGPEVYKSMMYRRPVWL